MDHLPPLPSVPTDPPRHSFPVIAVIVPLVGAVGIALVIGSPYLLIFAALSPLIAVATAVDARRTARRHCREEMRRFELECQEWLRHVPLAHAAERAEADREHPRAGGPVSVAQLNGQPSRIRVGTGPAISTVGPTGAVVGDDTAAGRSLRELLAVAGVNPALPVTVPIGPILLTGTGLVADSVARALSLEPGCELIRTRAGSETERFATTEISIESATRGLVRFVDGREQAFRPEGITARELRWLRAEREGSEVALPKSLAWARLGPDRSEPASAAVAIGIDEAGRVVEIDLLGDTPHALVGGTTGSGKSEFLRAVALSWAWQSPPSERAILLVDFKGGSAFAELSELPHVVGVITDLDSVGAQRALRSLRAEIRRRESLLLRHRARDISDAPPGALARLLVLVDEYAVLVESFPELQPLIADLAARGRSLGIHLVLCTQRPGGVVRDAVAANCGVRVAFRMTATSDAQGLMAASPPAADAPAGRAVVSIAGRAALVQVATICAADVAAVASRWATEARPERPWLPPLSREVTRHDVESLQQSGETREWSMALGILDDPDHQCRRVAEWRPDHDGSLLVIGADSRGVSAVLAVIAEGVRDAGGSLTVVPSTLADALSVLEELTEELDAPDAAGGDGSVTPPIVIVPDCDALLGEAGDRSLDLLEAIDAILRRVRRARGAVVAGCTSVLRARPGLVTRFDSALLLRAVSLDDHRAAGGAASDYDEDAPLGRGRWKGLAFQSRTDSEPVPPPRSAHVPLWSPAPGMPVAVVSGRPTRLAARLRSHGLIISDDPGRLDSSRASAGESSMTVPSGHAVTVVADVEAWHASWSALARARREGAVVLADVSEADARALIGSRMAVPVRSPAPDEVVLVDADGCRRARWLSLTGPAREP
jgi:DNA segregation ATPase FtsK/SpoIIIE, S-DNA-T family